MVKTKKLLIRSAIIGVALLGVQLLKGRRRRRSQWTKKWLHRRAERRGTLNLLNNELRIEDPDAYKNFLRLDERQFTLLLSLIEKDIRKEDTFMREAITARHRLEIKMRFLATGENYRSLMYSMRVHESTISKIVPEVCTAIYTSLKGTYLNTPTTEEEWLKIAANYKEKWNFPNCLGALDGRHIVFNAPISSGSYYYNYKNTNSIVLLGVMDANYKFIYANVGVNGRISDGGVFEGCNLFKRLQNGTLSIPKPRHLLGTTELPYVFIADDAFPLMNNLMKPFPQRGLNFKNRIYNYRLSRARRMVESGFGILANRWRVLLHPIHLSPEKVEIITLACVTLHNFLTTESPSYTDDHFENDTGNLTQLDRQGGNRSRDSARLIRENFRDYFNSIAGPWQNDAVKRGNYNKLP